MLGQERMTKCLTNSTGEGASVAKPVIPFYVSGRVGMGRKGKAYNRTVRREALSLWRRHSLGLRIRAGCDERGGAQAKGTEGDVRRDIGKACPQGKEHCGGRE